MSAIVNVRLVRGFTSGRSPGETGAAASGRFESKGEAYDGSIVRHKSHPGSARSHYFGISHEFTALVDGYNFLSERPAFSRVALIPPCTTCSVER